MNEDNLEILIKIKESLQDGYDNPNLRTHQPLLTKKAVDVLYQLITAVIDYEHIQREIENDPTIKHTELPES